MGDKILKCFNCGQPVIFDEGHYSAVDEDKIMCIECYDKIVKHSSNNSKKEK